MLAALGSAEFDPSKLNIGDLAQPPWFVPETTSVREQLNQFLKRKAQLASCDEYGTVLGLITLEDILEEIVGQIADEHDSPDSAVRPQVDGSVNVDGTVPVRDLNRQMHWSLPEEEATTVAGLVIHEAETIPEPGKLSPSTAIASKSSQEPQQDNGTPRPPGCAGSPRRQRRQGPTRSTSEPQ